MRWFLIYLISSSAALATPLLLSPGESKILNIAQIKRVSVARRRILKLTPLPPDRLLIHALAEGRTSVSVWDASEKVSEFEVQVVSYRYRALAQGNPEGQVVRVLLEMYELSDLDREKLGIQWPTAAAGVGQADWVSHGGPGEVTFKGQAALAPASLQALQQEGKAKLVARPDLTVKLGEEGIFHSGGEFPVQTSTEDYGRYRRQVEWKPYGLTVKIRPLSLNGHLVESEILVETSDLLGKENAETPPSLTKKKVQTKILSRDGERVVLSAMARDSSHQQKEGVYFLKSLPIVGPLFSSQSQDSETSQLLIAMTLSFRTRQSDVERLNAWQEFNETP